MVISQARTAYLGTKNETAPPRGQDDAAAGGGEEEDEAPGRAGGDEITRQPWRQATR